MNASAAASTSASPITAASNLFVAEHLAAASAVGQRLAEVVADPAAFTEALRAGLEELADPAVVDGIHSIAPGLGPVLGVRLPLMDAVQKSFKRGTRDTSSAQLLDAMDRIMRHDIRELRWFGIWNLGRLLPTDPERTWQLLRRAAAEADEWITVDTLAHPYGEGILREPRRWAEIEQLVYSPSRWERRLVGSAIATLPHVRGVAGGRGPEVVERGLTLMGQLIGDSEPDVQKALSWALRTLAALDVAATARFLEVETRTAHATDDGHRAWVIRDSLSKLPTVTATRLRASLDGIRRRPGAPSTSSAAATAAAFMAGGAPHFAPHQAPPGPIAAHTTPED